MSFRYFGKWTPDGGGVRFPTPIGMTCHLCNETFDVGDCGTYASVSLRGEAPEVLLPSHRECAFRSVMGGIGHLEDHNFWCSDAVNDPDGGRSYRESALEVWEWAKQHPISGIEGAL